MDVIDVSQYTSLSPEAPRRNGSDISINSMQTNLQQIIEEETKNNLNEFTDEMQARVHL